MVSFYVDCLLILTEVNERAVTARVSEHSQVVSLFPCSLAIFILSCLYQSRSYLS